MEIICDLVHLLYMKIQVIYTREEMNKKRPGKSI